MIGNKQKLVLENGFLVIFLSMLVGIVLLQANPMVNYLSDDGGVFTYIGTQNAPRTFADLVARDPKAMKRYTGKLMKDLKAAGGLTAWDHEVCATLVNHYAGGTEMPGIKKPDAKRLKALNDCVLAPVMELEEIVVRRKK